MKNYTVRKYSLEDRASWNAFIGEAKNATFLFHRDFMEYHSDRFQDFSLIVSDGKKWVAALPANRIGDTVFSHQGLTYGGFVINDTIKLPQFISIIKASLEFLSNNGAEKLHIKMIPPIYFNLPSDELNYVLFLLDSVLVRRDALSVIDLREIFNISRCRLRSVKRGVRNNLVIREEAEFETFWNKILIPNLDKKHNSKPVHTAKEIEKLKNLFPYNIRQFNVYHNNEIVAGTTVFITKNVIHPQYISGNSSKNDLGSIDFLYDYLINDVFKNSKFFDFGPSNEENGRKLKEGILFWKESFGAKTVIQDFYEIKTASSVNLEDILI